MDEEAVGKVRRTEKYVRPFHLGLCLHLTFDRLFPYNQRRPAQEPLDGSCIGTQLVDKDGSPDWPAQHQLFPSPVILGEFWQNMS